MYQAGLSARAFKSYDTTILVAEKQRELGLREEETYVQSKLDLDDKDRELSHIEKSSDLV
jgi:hypothetical protein